ncbi:spermidine synthase [Terricaulis sp.]|uniref:spermidine synthase n=1 Tax=Terricaulis sp. TaxID=2768686 RepID=UPI003783E34B
MTRELARRDGLFGPIRVLERKHDGARLYCINGSLQTLMLADGVSAFGYVHAAKILVAEAPNVLIIGGAGGSLATMLATRGHSVTVIDIDPAAEQIARDFFNLPPQVRWVTADPLHFITAQEGVFDAVIVDACDSSGIVSPFDKPGVIADLLMKACPRGSLVVNIVAEDGAPPWGGWLAAKLASLGLSVCLFRSEEGWEGNEILHVRVDGPTDRLAITDLEQRPPEARTYLMSLRPHVASHVPVPATSDNGAS